ncbi:hypothetical protein [Blastopirellula marina]|nr:hypothetical protein [Blastopirellula marina]
MKRQIAFFSIAAAILFAAPQLANAGYWQYQDRLASDAYQLHQATHRLHGLIHHRTGFSHLDDEALNLDEAAAHFAETARHGGSLSHLRLDFKVASRELQHVQSLITYTYRVRRDWAVQQAWADVERAFDRVYYDLYSNHCRYVSYTCQIGGVIHDHGHDHHDHHGPFHNNTGPFHGPQIGGLIKVGPVTIQTKKVFTNPSSAWNNRFNKGFNR